jgi:hypothetical protein
MDVVVDFRKKILGWAYCVGKTRTNFRVWMRQTDAVEMLTVSGKARRLVTVLTG